MSFQDEIYGSTVALVGYQVGTPTLVPLSLALLGLLKAVRAHKLAGDFHPPWALPTLSVWQFGNSNADWEAVQAMVYEFGSRTTQVYVKPCFTGFYENLQPEDAPGYWHPSKSAEDGSQALVWLRTWHDDLEAWVARQCESKANWAAQKRADREQRTDAKTNLEEILGLLDLQTEARDFLDSGVHESLYGQLLLDSLLTSARGLRAWKEGRV